MHENDLSYLREHLRRIPDFPKPGILFRDITPLLLDPKALKLTLDGLEEHFRGKRLDKIVAMESRGFLFGVALADRLGLGFVPVRKPGKLPGRTESVTYQLEYGTDSLEIHADALSQGDKVWVIDDLLATGGTARATVELVRRLGARVMGASFVVELAELGGRKKLGDVPEIQALLVE